MTTGSTRPTARDAARTVLEVLEVLVPLGPGPVADALRRGGRPQERWRDER